MRKNKNNVPLLNDEQDSIASSFYENLPFEGLQIPPKQVKKLLNVKMPDKMVLRPWPHLPLTFWTMLMMNIWIQMNMDQ